VGKRNSPYRKTNDPDDDEDDTYYSSGFHVASFLHAIKLWLNCADAAAASLISEQRRTEASQEGRLEKGAGQ
jgi:hypothetical protein